MADLVRTRWQDATLFVALLGTGLALGGALAHAYEMFNKLDMSGADYLVTQRAYDGWNQLAYVLVIELAGMVGALVALRGEGLRFRAVAVALVALLASQAVFWIWTFPANRATDNWTMQPEDWEALRAQWEYSHFAGAVLQLVAFVALIVAALARGEGRGQLSGQARAPAQGR